VRLEPARRLPVHRVLAWGRTQLDVGPIRLLGLALQRSLNIGNRAVTLERDSQRHCLITLTFFPFVPAQTATVLQNHASSGGTQLGTSRVVMSTGIWRLVGLACTLAALFLVN